MQSQGDPESEPALRLRITHIVSSMAPPLASLRQHYIAPSLPTAVPPGIIPNLVPLIRIFGTSPSAQKICANVHLCYPYFFVPFPMDTSSDPLRPERVVRLCQRFAVSLNHAICMALRQNPTGQTAASNYGGGTDPRHLHVASVMLVKGVPFYGYHVGYEYFLKVSLINPARMRIAVEQLRRPVVLGREWQPHEAHLSHTLQVMCDFDLYGCGYLDLSGGTFREPLPDPNDDDFALEDIPDAITAGSVSPSMVYPTGLSPARDTHTALEIDVLPHQILNRIRLTARALHHDFVELLHQPLHPDEKLVPAMRELWEDERRRRAARGMGTTEKDMLPVSGGGRGRSMQELGYKVDGEEVDNRGGDWKISKELWSILEEKMGAERARRGKLTFDRFSIDLAAGKNGERRRYDKWIMTIFDAISAHWPEGHRPLTARSQRGTRRSRPPTQAAPGDAQSSSPPPSSSQPILGEDDDEDNPFDLAATQASQGERVVAEVDAESVLPAIEEEEEEEGDQEEALHAKESERFRATQKVPHDFDDFGDLDMDEFLRQDLPGETPPNRRQSTPGTSKTLTSGDSRGGADTTVRRRENGHRRLAEQAGFGDLSTIMDMSVTFSSPSANPFADPQTPTRNRSNGEHPTPASLVRNIFARSRASPLNTPSKRASSPQTPSKTPVIVLPSARRSLAKLSQQSSPAREKDDDVTTPSKPPQPPLKEVRVRAEDEEYEFVPNAQPSRKRPQMSATSVDLNPHRTPTAAPRSTLPMAPPTTGPTPNGRPKKRVRLSSPSKPETTPPTPMPQSTVQVNGSTGSLLSSQNTSTGVSNDSGLELAEGAWMFAEPPPSRRHIVDSMTEYGLDTIEYHEPFYSDPADVPPRPTRFAGREFRVKGNGVTNLVPFESELPKPSTGWLKTKALELVQARYGWEYGPPPPTLRAVVAFCTKEDADNMAAIATSQLAVPTQKNRYGFKLSQKKPLREQQAMSVLLLEVFAPSRFQLLPDPEQDEMMAVFFCFQNDRADLPNTTKFPGYHAGYVVVDSDQTAAGRRARLDGIPCHYVDSELELINWIIDVVKDWDPDVLAGWELHNASWGYFAARTREEFGTDPTEDLSRVIGTGGPSRKDAYAARHTSTFKVTGRHVLNIWRILRGEVTLNAYTFENVVFHLLHQRIPQYTAANLTALWKSQNPEHTTRVLKVLFQRVVLYAELTDAAEIVSKSAEFARVFGVDFDAVIFRGSQFKVESFIFRIAKPESFVMVSPSPKQVGLQNAPFAVPLIHEPESKFYPHPIVVLDFQSLYPSVMIAYNICYSTCLGRVEKFKGTDKFGFTELKVADGLLELLKDYLTVTPNGMVFVKPAVRKSLLAKMLGEILDTRVMVKQAMKHARGDKNLTQMLNARQLGLKLMANVTYGYTSATFSGRMPCIEIADSIVQTGRETLEKAQEMIHSRADWDATVVYGDTDSLFIALPGRSKEQAFKIGHDIADAVTAANPKPVKLKFEKVYMGSLLMAKKRYVGFKYEHPDDMEPVFDAKGIETIRRDGFPAQQKIEETCLKMLFRNQDLSEIKDFCRQEWTKILTGRVSVQDFIIAKEVRLGTYSENGVPPPGAAVAYRRILKDPRDEPQYAERVPYVISNAPERRLIERARTPNEMIASRALGIDAEYYIRNMLIPPLSRIFNLVGADVAAWYDTMPRTRRVQNYGGGGGQATTAATKVDAHFRSSHCVVCNERISGPADALCGGCRSEPAAAAHALLSREHVATSRVRDLHRICASCSDTPVAEPVLCSSIDCPVTYARTAAERDAHDASGARRLIESLEW